MKTLSSVIGAAFALSLAVVPMAKAESADNLIKVVASQSNVSADQAAQEVNAVFSAIEAELKAGRDVSIRRFGGMAPEYCELLANAFHPGVVGT